jgi:hypothetical protein
MLLVQNARHVFWPGEEPLQRRLEHLDLHHSSGEQTRLLSYQMR